MSRRGVLLSSDHNNSSNSFCRLCGNGKDTFASHCNVFDRKDLADLVYKYLSIKISQVDTLPTSVCDECREKIETFHEYAMRCQDLQETLQADSKMISVENGSPFLPQGHDGEQDTVCKEEADIKLENSHEEFDCKDDFDFCDEDILPLSECIPNRVKKKERTAKKKTRKCITANEGKNFKRETRRSKRIIESNDEEINAENEEIVSNSNEVQNNNEKLHLEHSYIVYKCHVCQETCQNWCDLEKHVMSKHLVKARVVCICNQTLTSVSAIIRHINKHGKNVSTHTCDKCNKVYLKKSNYERHMLSHGDTKNATIERLYECNKCMTILASSTSYARHALKHRDSKYKMKTKCKTCDKVFSTEQSLKSHTQTVHEKLKPFVCDVCGHAFNQKNNLINHMIVHTERQIFHCEYCPRKFTNKRYLKTHLLCHSGVSFKCPVCPAVFNYKGTLNNHMYIHQNIKRFVCGFCNKGFKWQTSLKTHINIHTGATPYTCPWCPRSFSDRSNCRLHKKKHHPKELAEYERKNGIVHLGKTLQFEKKNASVVPLKDPNKVKLLVYPKVSS